MATSKSNSPGSDTVRLLSYSNSPIHMCVIKNDLTELRSHISRLPRLSVPTSIRSFADAELQNRLADEISAVLDRRDVPNGETPLHLAIRLNRANLAAELLDAGADPSLQNASGWNPHQESIFMRRTNYMSRLILLHQRSLTIHKWRRRLPALVAAVDRIRDFYIEINFKFESSVIPSFLTAQAFPSDTYRIWKRGTKIRVDTSFAGYEGLRVLKSNRTFLFLGGNPSEELEFGCVLEITHGSKSIRDCMDPLLWADDEGLVGEDGDDLFRPGIDVTKAELVGRTNWWKKEKVEIVGEWKTRIYEIQNVFYTVKTRKKDEITRSVREPSTILEDLVIDEGEDDGFLVAELPPRASVSAVAPSRRSCVDLSRSDCASKKSRTKENDRKCLTSTSRPVPARHSCVELSESKRRGKGKLGKDSDSSGIEWDLFAVEEEVAPDNTAPRRSCYEPRWRQDERSEKRSPSEKVSENVDMAKENPNEWEKLLDNGGIRKAGMEKEMKKSLRPAVWLTEDFPLKTEEVIPLLDVIANKVKPALRLREMLTTKFPAGTFPVKVAIPVFSTVRAVITFTKFVELQPNPEPSSNPREEETGADEKPKQGNGGKSSWLRWGSGNSGSRSKSVSPSPHIGDGSDPFVIPSDYAWRGHLNNNNGKQKARPVVVVNKCPA